MCRKKICIIYTFILLKDCVPKADKALSTPTIISNSSLASETIFQENFCMSNLKNYDSNLTPFFEMYLYLVNILRNSQGFIQPMNIFIDVTATFQNQSNHLKRLQWF